MPFNFKPYEPPPLTNLRERLLTSKLELVDRYEQDFANSLQDAVQRGSVSRAQLAVNQQELNSIRDLKSNLRNGLETVRQQDAAEREAQRRMADDDALTNGRARLGFFRSGQDRVAAIEGILQRERRQSAPLTREAWSRAKAIAASRRSFDPRTSELRGARGSQYAPSANDIDRTQAGFDPCVDAKRVRREVMFAQKTAGIGYRTRHRYRPC